MNGARDTIQKLREVSGEGPAKEVQKELEEATELSKLMAKRAHLQKAIDNLKDVEGCQEELDSR